MIPTLIILTALSGAPADEPTIPEDAAELFDALPLMTRWHIVMDRYKANDEWDRQVANQLFARLTADDKAKIRKQLAEDRRRAESNVVRLDTSDNDIEHANNLDKLESIRKKVLLYLEDMNRDAHSNRSNRAQLAINECQRFLDAYKLCKRDANRHHVDVACRRGEYCVRVLQSMYGPK